MTMTGSLFLNLWNPKLSLSSNNVDRDVVTPVVQMDCTSLSNVPSENKMLPFMFSVCHIQWDANVSATYEQRWIRRKISLEMTHLVSRVYVTICSYFWTNEVIDLNQLGLQSRSDGQDHLQHIFISQLKQNVKQFVESAQALSVSVDLKLSTKSFF